MTDRDPAARERDERHLRNALGLAQAALGQTSPNPAVGCVIVRAGRVIGRGVTARGGRPHAEAVALAEAGRRARGATAYVSLEPCAHQGQTPPCARALVAAGVARVVIGCRDPYPLVRGRGITILKRAGVAVTLGVLEAECRALNEGFFTRVTRGRPFAILKLALTLDGRIASAGGDSRWISSSESRALVHQWRRECDAVIVGAGTVTADNPRLTCRLPDGHDPARIVVDPRLRADPSLRLFRQRSLAPTIVVTTVGRHGAAQRRYGPRVEILGISNAGGGLDLAALMRTLGQRGWSRVLVEGGAHLAGAMLRAGLIDRVAFFVAPKILGGGLAAIEGLDAATIRGALKLAGLRARTIGADWLLEAEVVH